MKTFSTNTFIILGLFGGLPGPAFGQIDAALNEHHLFAHQTEAFEEVQPGIVSTAAPEGNPTALKGWFAAVDLGANWTQVGLGVYGPPNPDLSRLGWGVLPRAELGYRFDSGGSVLFDYSYLGDAVNASTPTPCGETRASFTTQTYAVDYRSSVYGSRWANVQWQGGFRVGALSYSTNYLWTNPDVTGLQSRHEIVAAGPHFGLRPILHLADTGWAFFTLIDGGALTGIETHSIDALTNSSGVLSGGSDQERALAAVIQLDGEAGLSYTLPSAIGLRIEVGYKVESSFWDGHSFTSQGPFLRLGLGF